MHFHRLLFIYFFFICFFGSHVLIQSCIVLTRHVGFDVIYYGSRSYCFLLLTPEIIPYFIWGGGGGDGGGETISVGVFQRWIFSGAERGVMVLTLYSY